MAPFSFSLALFSGGLILAAFLFQRGSDLLPPRLVARHSAGIASLATDPVVEMEGSTDDPLYADDRNSTRSKPGAGTAAR